MSAPMSLFDTLASSSTHQVVDSHAVTYSPAVRHSDPSTSHAAAERVAPVRSSLRSRILEALVTPMTDDELCLALGIDVRRWPSCKTARSALYGQGLLVWTGQERNGQRVWQVYANTVDVQNGAL